MYTYTDIDTYTDTDNRQQTKGTYAYTDTGTYADTHTDTRNGKTDQLSSNFNACDSTANYEDML